MAAPLRKQSDLWAQVAFYSGLGFILPGGIVAGYVLGWYLDHRLHTQPVLTVVLAVLGATGGFLEILRILTRAEKDEDRRDANSRPGPS